VSNHYVQRPFMLLLSITDAGSLERFHMPTLPRGFCRSTCLTNDDPFRPQMSSNCPYDTPIFEQKHVQNLEAHINTSEICMGRRHELTSSAIQGGKFVPRVGEHPPRPLFPHQMSHCCRQKTMHSASAVHRSVLLD
jgi:hypothetical protein